MLLAFSKGGCGTWILTALGVSYSVTKAIDKPLGFQKMPSASQHSTQLPIPILSWYRCQPSLEQEGRLVQAGGCRRVLQDGVGLLLSHSTRRSVSPLPRLQQLGNSTLMPTVLRG